MKTYKLLFFALIFVLLLGRVFADDSLYQYIERDKDKIKDFEQIEGKDRNELWKNAEDLNKAIAVKKLAQYINQRLRRGDSAFGMISEGMDIAKKLLPEKFFKELGDAKIDIVTDYNKAKETAKKYGVDLDGYVRAELESVRGFEAGDLKWSEKQGNKNTIGNGKVWLNLEKLPVQTTSVEYTDGKFVLGMKDGGKIVLEPGSTNENGELVSFTKWRDKFEKEFLEGKFDKDIEKILSMAPTKLAEYNKLDKNNPEKLKIARGALGIKDISDSIIVPSVSGLTPRNLALKDGKGELTVTADGFKLTGDGARASFGDFVFERKGSSNEEAYVNFLEDRIHAKGIEYTRMDFAKVDAKQETIIHFGNKEALAQMVSFTDYREIDVMKGGTYMGAGGYLAKDYVPIKKWLQFNENGEVTHIAKNDEEWVPIVGDYKGKGVLADIYAQSGKTVQGIIERANNGESTNYNLFKKAFYSDDTLKTSDAQTIKIESYQKNFVNFDANNIDVGGTGKIEILRDVSKLEGINADRFEIKAGDAVIEISGTDIMIPTLLHGGTYPKIDYIAGKVESGGEVSVGTRKKIGLDSNGVFTTDNSVVRSGDLVSKDVGNGVTLNSYLSFDKKDIEGVRMKVESVGASKQRDVMIEGAMQKQFSVNLDVFMPIEGVSLPGASSKKAYDDKFKKMLTDNLLSQSLNLDVVGEVSLDESKKKMIETIASNIVEKLTSQNLPLGGLYHFELVNNPSGNAQIIASVPNSNRNGMSRTVIEIQDAAQNKLFKDVFEASLRVPDFGKGTMPGTISIGYQRTYYASQAYYDLWRENIGRSIKPLGVNDALYFAGSEFIRGKIRERTYWDGIVGRLGGVHDKEGLLDKYTPKKK